MQKLKSRLKINRGSILAVSLIILGLMLVSALSFSLVSIQERKASTGANKSSQALQTAGTGVEIVLQSIKNHRDDNTLANVDTDTACDGTVHSADNSYAVQLQDDAGNIVPCTSSVSAVKKVKSVGLIGQNQRAVEVAVANIPQGCQWYDGTETKVCGPGGNGWCQYTGLTANAPTSHKLCDIKTGGKGWAAITWQSGANPVPLYQWAIIDGNWGWTTGGNSYIEGVYCCSF